MTRFGKIISAILVFSFVLSFSSFAAVNSDYADTLYKLDLFKGTENGYELDKTFTREEAVTMLVRLLGEEKTITQRSYNNTFSDVPPARWSYPYVMYCYENEITKGTGEGEFSPETPISAEEFITLVLRLLGYTDVEPENAFQESITCRLLNSEIAAEFEANDEFLRDDMVYVVYRSLMTENSEGTLLADVLAQKGVITESEAKEFDVYESSADINELLDKLMN